MSQQVRQLNLTPGAPSYRRLIGGAAHGRLVPTHDGSDHYVTCDHRPETHLNAREDFSPAVPPLDRYVAFDIMVGGDTTLYLYIPEDWGNLPEHSIIRNIVMALVENANEDRS